MVVGATGQPFYNAANLVALGLNYTKDFVIILILRMMETTVKETVFSMRNVI